MAKVCDPAPFQSHLGRGSRCPQHGAPVAGPKSSRQDTQSRILWIHPSPLLFDPSPLSIVVFSVSCVTAPVCIPPYFALVLSPWWTNTQVPQKAAARVGRARRDAHFVLPTKSFDLLSTLSVVELLKRNLCAPKRNILVFIAANLSRLLPCFILIFCAANCTLLV